MFIFAIESINILIWLSYLNLFYKIKTANIDCGNKYNNYKIIKFYNITIFIYIYIYIN